MNDYRSSYEEGPTDALPRPQPLPMKPTRRKPGMPNKFRESTVHEITKEIPEKNRKNNTITHNLTLAKRREGETIRNEINDEPRPKRYHKRGSSRRKPNKNYTNFTKKKLHYYVHRRINERDRTGKPNGSGMGNILERNREEKRERRDG